MKINQPVCIHLATLENSVLVSSKAILSSSHQGSEQFPTQGICCFQYHHLSHITTFSFSARPFPSAYSHALRPHIHFQTHAFPPFPIHIKISQDLFLLSPLPYPLSPSILFELSYLALRLSSYSLTLFTSICFLFLECTELILTPRPLPLLSTLAEVLFIRLVSLLCLCSKVTSTVKP